MIHFDEQNRIFQIDTKSTSYLIGIVDTAGYVGHIYYGARIPAGQDMSYLFRIHEKPFVPSVNAGELGSFLDAFPAEYPGDGVGDYRENAVAVRNARGQSGCAFFYDSYEIRRGKYSLPGLPATFDREGNDAETLVIHCIDPYLHLRADLLYGVFEDEDVVTRSVIFKNENHTALRLDKALSACITLENRAFETLTLHGSWAREREIERRPLLHGTTSVGSSRGSSSHQEQPFMALVTPNTTQTEGEVWAMHFVYSGSFTARAELDQFDRVRLMMGINPEGFSWKLGAGETFAVPEVVMTFSGNGLGEMTRHFHQLYRKHLIRSTYLHKARPVLVNNWEATYFDFDEEKLLSIAKKAKELGIEMLVMDDGWFGHRMREDSSLGDWYVNETRLPKGLKHLVDAVKRLGMRFGIWMEPEMISPNSDLCRAHPDWALRTADRPGTLIRTQYVLDLSRAEVRDYVWNCIKNVLDSADISYLKWDMNRTLTNIGSLALPEDRQGELAHRYTLGVYEIQERLVREYPDLLFENCTSGGGRFDPGMLYFSPQIWCSDDTDAIERLVIQEGTELIYPLSTMGAHVSVCPNHLVGRITPLWTRSDVAMAGTFGYELDVRKLSPEDQKAVPKQIKIYHKYGELIREGNYYRIASYRENHLYDAWMVVSEDRKEAILWYVQVKARANAKSRILYLAGLDENAVYHVTYLHDAPEAGSYPAEMNGGVMMRAGFPVPDLMGDFQSRMICFRSE